MVKTNFKVGFNLKVKRLFLKEKKEKSSAKKERVLNSEFNKLNKKNDKCRK